MYAAGRPHENKRPSLDFLERVAKSHSAHQYCINTEVLQEILHRYHAINRFSEGSKLFDAVLNLGLVIYAVELADITIARALLADSSAISTRDAVHIAMAKRRNLQAIVSYDRSLAAMSEIKVVIPTIL
jgi:predicted nucleic acid-binding protein